MLHPNHTVSDLHQEKKNRTVSDLYRLVKKKGKRKGRREDDDHVGQVMYTQAVFSRRSCVVASGSADPDDFRETLSTQQFFTV